jgi:hypothetical protein
VVRTMKRFTEKQILTIFREADGELEDLRKRQNLSDRSRFRWWRQFVEQSLKSEKELKAEFVALEKQLVRLEETTATSRDRSPGSVRLSDRQVAALGDAVHISVTRKARRGRRFIADIEAALTEYRERRSRPRYAPGYGVVKRAEKIENALWAVICLLPDGADEDVAKAAVMRLYRTWRKEAADLRHARRERAHRPADHFVGALCRAVVGALDKARVDLSLGRRTELIEVLQLVLTWADDIAGRRPRQRKNLYAVAKTAIAGYRAEAKRMSTLNHHPVPE